MKSYRNICRLGAVALIAITLFAAPVAHSEEGGVGHYFPGGMATLIDLPPTQAGWVIEAMYLRYEGGLSGDQTLPVAGLLTGAIDAKSDAMTLGALYTFDKKVLGAYYTIGALLPYVWMDVTAQVSLGNRSFKKYDQADGIGDMLIIPAMMAWKINDWQISGLLPIYAPTGDYKVGRLANPGLNHWTFDPTFGGAYSNAKTGFNASVYSGFALSSRNKDTDYRNGTVFHLDTGVQQLLPLGKGFVGIGAEAVYYQQVTGDSGSGARLGGNKGNIFGLGPVLSYLLPMGRNNLVAEVRWLTELETERRLKGDYIWFKLIYQF